MMDRIVIETTPRFELSRHLYMQFMEPLGVTDSSVEAAWNHDDGCWRNDFVDTVKKLSPGCIRWGGILSSFYKWREAVGPRQGRIPMRNYMWGGIESNQVGTHEFVDLCREVGADPLICVNFMGDGRPEYLKTAIGEERWGSAAEAADWVSYCNDPGSSERRRNGCTEPLNVKLWQIGNETSYHNKGFEREEAIRRTTEFAKAMKERDKSIKLIGWGDRGSRGEGYWAPDMLTNAGSVLDYIAIHMMDLFPRKNPSILRGNEYRKDRHQAWAELNTIYSTIEPKLNQIRDYIKEAGTGTALAITEGHLSLSPHNANPILTEWQSALFHARVANLYERHGDLVKIATLADFCGTRWTVNAVMIPVPHGRSYLMPVGHVMSLYGTHMGSHSIEVTHCPSDLDIAASIGEGCIYLHVVNTNLDYAVEAVIDLADSKPVSGELIGYAPEDISAYVNQDNPNPFNYAITPLSNTAVKFPPASVSVVKLSLY